MVQRTTFLYVMLSSLTLLSCVVEPQKKPEVNREEFARHQIKEWRKELVANGEVGAPCDSDEMKWIERYPVSFYGLPDSVNYRFSDANGDGKEDLLLFFEAGECCTGGHEEGADFLSLYYISDSGYLRNDHLRTEITQRIGENYFQQTQNEARRVIFSVTGFEKEILGTFKLWRQEDPDCCAGIEGTFSYNVKNWAIKVESHQVFK